MGGGVAGANEKASAVPGGAAVIHRSMEPMARATGRRSPGPADFFSFYFYLIFIIFFFLFWSREFNDSGAAD